MARSYRYTFSFSETRKQIGVIYLVGAIGYSVPFTRNIFIFLTSFVLVLSCAVLYFSHQKLEEDENIQKWPILWILLAIGLVGYLVEVIGVQTGVIFGEYAYGRALGPKIWATPPVIGMNWAMLSYMFAEAAQRISADKVVRILIGSAGMLMYDLLLEQVAPLLDQWSWSGDVVPIKNYLAWGTLALIFQTIIVLKAEKFSSILSRYLLTFQFLMFLVVYCVHQFLQTLTN